ncbi:lysozyme C-like [Sinocyclocheilus anshuiensis]|uniref:lysozyme C-like n=1 Tax=Sinocyclocheilus anshuiensis TaxID=1608454 RepID=UPI0007B8AF9E|nr:PREDICTED: lysozyme C-like [Sinocyclocheilus anshuiensis]
MKSVNPVKMLAAFALGFLVSSVTEGRIISKCELKEQLEAAQIQVIRAMGDKMTVNDLNARLVCLAGATGFNTSFKDIPAKPKEPLNSHSIKPNTTQRPVRHLYGVFQLSDQLACDSGMNPSLNVCNTSCTAFTDDDVTDDIACLNIIISSIKPRPKNNITLPLVTLSTILVKACHFVVPSLYFAELRVRPNGPSFHLLGRIQDLQSGQFLSSPQPPQQSQPQDPPQ